MPNSGAAAGISTVIKVSCNPLISREIPIKIAAEMEALAGGIRERVLSGRGISKLSLGGVDPLPYMSMLPGE